MQVYRDLRVLTARPEPEEAREAPHRLFGEVDGAVNFSVGRWLEAATAILAREAGPFIFVGGTGLYFRALTEGLSDIPAVPEEARQRVRAEAEGMATSDLHDRLAARDPATAARLRPSDRQRVLRALEVFDATGRPLVDFQDARNPPPLAPGEWAGLFLAPPRAILDARIETRFAEMLRAGALDEIEALARRRLEPALPIMRAHGAPHLIAHLAGRLPIFEAAALAVRDTRRYAKRQFTWARHQMPDFQWVAPEDAEAAGARAFLADGD